MEHSSLGFLSPDVNRAFMSRAVRDAVREAVMSHSRDVCQSVIPCLSLRVVYLCRVSHVA